MTEDIVPSSEDQAPGTDPDTQDVQPGTQVTDDDSTKVTADQEPDGSDDSDDDDNPIERAFTSRWELEVEKLRENITAEVRAELEARQADERRLTRSTAERQAIQNAFGSAIKMARDGLRGLEVFDADGNPAQLSDTAIEELVVKPFQAYNAQVQDAEQLRIYTNLAETAVGTLPAAIRDEFSDKAANKPLDQWLRTYAELLAPHTEFFKNHEREQKAKLDAAEARGFAKGQRSPSGTPKQVNERSSKGTPSYDLNTPTGLIAAQRAGKIDEAKFRELWAQL